MQYVTDLAAFRTEGETAVTLGKFDALHLGHQKLIHQIRQYAGGSNGRIKSVVFAFDMHREALITGTEKRELLEGKTDVLVACPFTREIREMSAERFIKEILAERLHARYIVVGTDYRFGHMQKGNVDTLRAFASRYGYHLDVIEKEKYQGREISSTYIRELMSEGNIALANLLLGYTYQIEGTVRPGNRIGRRIGFPTMNVAPAERKIVPRRGVYACQVEVDGKWYHAIGNVGVKPTVEVDPVLLVEVYVFGYRQEAYGKRIRVRFCEFERPETKFDGIDALKAQLEKDMVFGREYFGIKEGS